MVYPCEPHSINGTMATLLIYGTGHGRERISDLGEARLANRQGSKRRLRSSSILHGGVSADFLPQLADDPFDHRQPFREVRCSSRQTVERLLQRLLLERRRWPGVARAVARAPPLVS